MYVHIKSCVRTKLCDVIRGVPRWNIHTDQCSQWVAQRPFEEHVLVDSLDDVLTGIIDFGDTYASHPRLICVGGINQMTERRFYLATRRRVL